MAGRGDLTKGVQRLVSEDKFRGQAKDAYLKHTSANSSLDILERCKRLNEFLSTVSVLPLVAAGVHLHHSEP